MKGVDVIIQTGISIAFLLQYYGIGLLYGRNFAPAGCLTKEYRYVKVKKIFNYAVAEARNTALFARLKAFWKARAFAKSFVL